MISDNNLINRDIFSFLPQILTLTCLSCLGTASSCSLRQLETVLEAAECLGIRLENLDFSGTVQHNQYQPLKYLYLHYLYLQYMLLQYLYLQYLCQQYQYLQYQYLQYQYLQ